MLSEEQPQPSQEEEKHHLAPTEAAIAHHSQIEITTRTPFNPVNEQLIDDFVGSLPEIVESEEQLKQIIRGMKRESRYHPLTSKENLKRIVHKIRTDKLRKRHDDDLEELSIEEEIMVENVDERERRCPTMTILSSDNFLPPRTLYRICSLILCEDPFKSRPNE